MIKTIITLSLFFTFWLIFIITENFLYGLIQFGLGLLLVFVYLYEVLDD